MTNLLQPGQLFARRYRIEKFLAKGGFGAVYAAEQAETELRVALKVLWPHVLHSQDAVEKFKLEARVAGRVGSEHIVKVFDAGFDDTTQMPFLCMELLDGEHLEKLVAGKGPLSPGLLVTYFRQICSALDRAHRYVDKDGTTKPIVHRDLKPENLFLCNRESGDPIMKILDFGIAKVLSSSTVVSQDIKGTPLYMAFEQASAGRITPQTDIWALGLIAFFLLTGRCYWKSANLSEPSLTQLFGEVLAMTIDPPSRRAAELGAAVVPSAAFDAWFARCVNREVSARFASAGECATALAAVFGSPEIRVGGGAFGAGAFAATEEAHRGTSGTTSIAQSLARAGDSRSIVEATGGPLTLGRTNAPLPRSSGRLLGAGLFAVLVIGSGATIVAMRTGSNPSPVIPPVAASPAPAPVPSPVPAQQPVAPVAVVAPIASAEPRAETTPPAPVESARPEKRTPKLNRLAGTTQPAAALVSAPPTGNAKPAAEDLYDER